MGDWTQGLGQGLSGLLANQYANAGYWLTGGTTNASSSIYITGNGIPAITSAPEPDNSAVAWLDRRVNEIRVKL